ncbi:MAG TPA: glycosyl hydrolase family 28 protein [Verrucomicrobiae bacterium]|nr:glycosyl hydrolase family 28 protein [Verrucomicrobiae bacterium]
MAQPTSANPTLPVISNQTFIVTNAAYGAIGDGVTNNAPAIQSAINYAVSHGGGTVEIPANGTLSTYLSGPIAMANGINLQVDGGALLQMLPYGIYPGSTNFIGGSRLHDIEISGSGTIDGQGAAWWAAYNASNSLARPHLIDCRTCTNVLVQNVTLQNPPMFHLVLMGTCVNVTVQGITINTVWPSPNTDGIDLVGTSCLIQNCFISDGDDDVAISPVVGSTASDIVVTNCTFHSGYGVAIGSNTAGGVSNLTVTSCMFDGSQYGITLKSDNNTNTSGTLNGRGGLVQNLSYSNLTMTNMVRAAISIASYYNEYSTPYNITPLGASTQAVGPVAIPIWRNITVSNVSAVVTGRIAGIFWARPEMPATNVVLNHVTITAPGPFNVYNAQAVEFVDSQINVPGKTNTLSLYNAQVAITNSVLSTNVMTLDGLVIPPTNNVLAFFNASVLMAHTNALGLAPVLTLAGSTVTVSNNLNLGGASVLNFGLGTNATRIAVTGNLSTAGTLNLTDGGGFTNGTYTLFTYGGTLTDNGLAIGSIPDANFTYAISTSTIRQVNLVVGVVPPLDPFVAWQLAWFGCTNLALCPQAAPGADPYGKGISNTNQFLVGLNPTNPASVFQILSVAPETNNDMVITWATGAGPTNIVQAGAGNAAGSYSTNFTDISGPLSIPGIGDVTNTFHDPDGATNNPSRYYRIRLGP